MDTETQNQNAVVRNGTGTQDTPPPSEHRTLIAIPCMDMVPVPFVKSLLNLRKTGDTAYAFLANSLIYDSRNVFVSNAIEKGYDRILWLDSDMVFEPDLLERLSRRLDEGYEYVSALAFKRKLPTGPAIYKRLDYGRDDQGHVHAKATAYTDYPRDALFEVAATGCAAVMMRVELLKDVWDRFGLPFLPLPNMGEDLSLCWRVAQLGRHMWCDSSVKVGHVGQYVFGEDAFVRLNAAILGGADDGNKQN